MANSQRLRPRPIAPDRSSEHPPQPASDAAHRETSPADTVPAPDRFRSPPRVPLWPADATSTPRAPARSQRRYGIHRDTRPPRSAPEPLAALENVGLIVAPSDHLGMDLVTVNRLRRLNVRR